MIFQVILFILPWNIRKFILKKMLGFSLGPQSRIGFSVVKARKVHLADGASIGHGNIIKGLEELSLGVNAIIGNGNWISANPLKCEPHYIGEVDRYPALILEDEAAITARHSFDCTNKVSIGRFSIIGGWSSTFLTHAIDLYESKQSSKAIIIGDYCFVGTGVIVTKGAILPNFSVLAAGSCLTSNYSQQWTLYGGVPAREVKGIDRAAAYFRRERGFVV